MKKELLNVIGLLNNRMEENSFNSLEKECLTIYDKNYVIFIELFNNKGYKHNSVTISNNYYNSYVYKYHHDNTIHVDFKLPKSVYKKLYSIYEILENEGYEEF